MNLILIVLILVCVNLAKGEECCEDKEEVSTVQGSWRMHPTVASWSLQARIPMSSEVGEARKGDKGDTRGKHKLKKKLKRYLIPLLLAYKIKFFFLVPTLMIGLILLTKLTGLSGFFFALFATVMGLKSGDGHY